MGAFDQYDMDKKKENTRERYGNYNLAGLESLGGQKNTPSPSGAASQGALGTPAPAGGAQKPVSDFHKMYMDSEDSDKDAVADKMEQQFGEQGLSLKGAVNKVFEQGGETAMQLAERFGYIPSEAQANSAEAFKTREQALSDYGVEMDNAKERDLADKKRLSDRRAMGGFLMDVGIRILASNRDDAGGAIAEGVLSTRQTRKDEARQKSADEVAAADRERKIRREDAADEAAKLKSARDEEKYQYDKSQRAADEQARERKGMVKTINKKGETYYYDPLDPKKGAYVEDADGNRVRSDTAMDLSKAQMATNARAYKQARARARTAIEKDIKDYDTQYPEIAEETDNKKREKMIDAAVDETLRRDGYTLGADNDDPLGLLQ